MVEIISIIVLVAVLAAIATDLRSAKIPNWLTAPLFLLGLAHAAWANGGMGVLDAVMAGAFYVIMTFVFSLAAGRMPPGGDIKLVAAIGACFGMNYWMPYFIGMWFARGILGLLVRLKISDFSPVRFAGNIKYEIYTNQDMALGEKNFRFMQSPARKAGLDPNGVYIPPPLWLFGGTLSVVIAIFWGS